jgi:Ala-tRNA(Pro) deacylase
MEVLMAIPKQIKNYLSASGASYYHKTHPVAYTAQQVAAVEHVPAAELAKTVVLRADERLILAVLPADHAINMEVLKKLAGCTRLALASESEFRDRFLPSVTGAMPPFGRLFGLEVFCDAALSWQPEMEFNGGTHTDTIRMRFSEFAKLEIPVVAFFSRKSAGKPMARAA